MTERDAYGRGAATDRAVRCWRCNKLLALYVTRPWRIACGRCKAICQAGDTLAEQAETPAP